MSQKPEDNGTLRESSGVGGSRGYWERQKLVATKWTTNSTMSIAKAANENGMPEPPQSYFETQDRLVRFFEEQKLGQYVEALRANDVNGAMLLECERDDEALSELGITSRLHISKLRTSLKAATARR